MTYSKQDKLNRIYEVIANKELSFGCRLHTQGDDCADICIYLADDQYWNTRCNLPSSMSTSDYDFMGDWFENRIGHPVMIGNCDKLIEKGPDYFDSWIPIIDLWIDKENPIENQSEKCIDYIYSLIK